MENSRRTTLTRAAVAGLISFVPCLLLANAADAAPPGATLAEGSSGPHVLALERLLDARHYFTGAVDGTFDGETTHAVMAFQKVTNRARTGIVDAPLVQALATAADPAPLLAGPAGPPDRVEVDLNRQVLFLYQRGALAKILAVSSGTDETPTPTGDYAVYHQSEGWETSALGRLYNSHYFTGGYAIHGSPSVPADRASHGCIRITMGAADWLPSQLSLGTPVFVR